MDHIAVRRSTPVNDEWDADALRLLVPAGGDRAGALLMLLLIATAKARIG